MSNSQTDIALEVIEQAQKKTGHKFLISDFKRLIDAGLSADDLSSKKMQDIIKEMINK